MKKEYIKPFVELVSFETDENLLTNETSGEIREGETKPDNWE